MRLTLTAAALAAMTFAGMPAAAQLHQYKPGFNLLTRDQDIQLGKEAASEIAKQVEIVNNRELAAYVSAIGAKLAAQPQADKYPYTFQVVNDPSINAFALPGGPAFVHTGLIAAVDNESQLAGVLAHEIVHVALRHGTNQLSRANLIQLPAMLAGAAAGSGILGQLTQLGVGLGANSLLLKYSRTAETQSDLMGVQIASQAGYNPIEMARFFEKLEAEGGARGPEFFSDHPNPGNRMKAIQDEIRYLPRTNYNQDSGRLARMKAIVAGLPAPKKAPAQNGPSVDGGGAQGGASPRGSAPAALSIPNSRPSGVTQVYRGEDFSLSYPGNWKPITGQNSSGVTIAPPSGVQQSNNGLAVGYGAVMDYYKPKQTNASLWQATDELVSALKSADPRMRTGRDMPKELTVGRKTAIVTTLYSDSIFQGQTEVDLLVTLAHPKGIFFITLVAPESEDQYARRAFDELLRSVRLGF